MAKRTPLQQLQDSLNDLFGHRAALDKQIEFKSAMIAERRLDANAAAKARRLVAKYPSISIDKGDAPGEHWVYLQLATDNGDDPLEGNHFCVGGRELLEAVETYVTYIEENQS